MSHIYRCSRCRTRNTWPRALATYVRGRQCRSCGYTRFYVDKERARRTVCRCSGYHHSHRPDSPCCEQNAQHEANRARRAGEPAEQIESLAVDTAIVNPARAWKGRGIPF